MFSNILMVCVGNICRSPTAEYLLRKKLEEKNSAIQVTSAGLGALIDKPADSTATELAASIGVNLAPHRARQLTTKMVHNSDLVLVMEQRHIKSVEKMVPSAMGKVHLLGRWNSNIEIPDPYRKGQPAFEHALSLIQLTVNEWAARI